LGIYKAPTARHIKARGKREAKRSASPLVTWTIQHEGLKGRNKRTQFRPFRAGLSDCFLTRGDALRACPGYHIPRRWRFDPYAVAPLALRFQKLPFAIRCAFARGVRGNAV